MSTSVYHVYTKSIEKYTIFRSPYDYERMVQAMVYYRLKNLPLGLAAALLVKQDNPVEAAWCKIERVEGTFVSIIAYCLMPTHIHFLIEEHEKKGMGTYMNKVLNSYTRYFNTRYERKGPLWQGRFGRRKVEGDEGIDPMLYYIHNNPVKSGLVDDNSEWVFSSYQEYNGQDVDRRVCTQMYKKGHSSTA